MTKFATAQGALLRYATLAFASLLALLGDRAQVAAAGGYHLEGVGYREQAL